MAADDGDAEEDGGEAGGEHSPQCSSRGDQAPSGRERGEERSKKPPTPRIESVGTLSTASPIISSAEYGDAVESIPTGCHSGGLRRMQSMGITSAAACSWKGLRLPWAARHDTSGDDQFQTSPEVILRAVGEGSGAALARTLADPQYAERPVRRADCGDRSLFAG